LEQELAGAEFELEAAVEGGDARKPLAQEPATSESALDTELELKTVGRQPKTEVKGEDFFDFTAGEQEGLELAEAPGAPQKAKAPGRKAAAPAKKEEEEEMVTDIVSLGAEEEVPEEDLLSEIMDIDEEQAGAKRAGKAEETEEITAEITTLEEPTYEESGLGQVLEGVPEAAAEEEAGTAPEFELPVAEAVTAAEATVGLLPVVLLTASLVLMLFAGIFVVENAVRPDLSTGLTSWVPVGK
jgi:hypothetical protein